MWVVMDVICKLIFLGNEDEILTMGTLKLRCRISCNVSVSVLTDIQSPLNGRHISKSIKD